MGSDQLEAEKRQVADVIEHLREHDAVAVQSVESEVSRYDFTEVTFRCRLHRAAETDTDAEE